MLERQPKILLQSGRIRERNGAGEQLFRSISNNCHPGRSLAKNLHLDRYIISFIDGKPRLLNQLVYLLPRNAFLQCLTAPTGVSSMSSVQLLELLSRSLPHTKSDTESEARCIAT